MRCLFIVRDFNKDRIRALPWKYAYELAKRLIAKGHDITLLTDASPAGMSFAERNQPLDVPVRLAPATSRLPMSYGMDPGEAMHIIKDFNPDLAYFLCDPLGGYYVKQLKRVNVPFLVHVSKNFHPMSKILLSMKDYSSFPPYFYFLNSPLAKFAVRLLNQKEIVKVTVPSVSIKKSLENCGVERTKIKVLPMTFDKDILSHPDMGLEQNTVLEKLGFNETDFIVTYFGPPHTRRGINELIQAISILKTRVPIKLLLLLRLNPMQSTSIVRSYEKKISKLNVANRVTLIANVLPKNTLIDFLKLSDVVALPFKFIDEEPPLTILEAMALGKPVITTKVGSLPEIIGRERGLLIETGSSRELAQAIYDIYRRPYEGDRLGAKAKEYAMSLCDWNDLAEHVLNLFKLVPARDL